MLKEIVRKRVLDEMICAVNPASKWKILVVDSIGLRIVTSVCKMHDILEQNVTLIEDISRRRQPYPQKEAIYFMTPSLATVEAFLRDYSDGRVAYAAAHLFFTSALSDELFEKIKNSPAVAFVKTLKELNIEFSALEHQAFVLDLPESFFPTFNQNFSEKREVQYNLMAKRLANVISSIGEYPNIRFYDPEKQKKGSAFRFATILQSQIESMAQEGGTLQGPNTTNSLNVIIIDRSMDVIAPLVHEFTYQAMMHDLLQVNEGKYQLKLDDGAETKKTTTASLDEYDPIWMLIRHWHYADAVDYIQESFQKFLNGNKAAASAMGSDQTGSGIEALNAMKDTLSALPEFQEMKLKFSAHINICQECKDCFGERQLDIIASIEQDMATGETADGRTPKNLLTSIIPLLDDPQVLTTDKIRLLMLYVVSQGGMHDADRRRLLELAKLTLEDAQSLTHLSYLNVPLVPGEKRKTDFPYYYFNKKTAKARRKTNSDAMTFDLSRYVPMLKFLLQDQMENKLDQSYFPYIKEPTKVGAGNAPKSMLSSLVSSNTPLIMGTGSNPWSLRTTRANWSTAKDTQKDQSVIKGTDYSKNGSRTVVFVLGGMTYSEIRCCYEVMNESKRDIIIGSSHVLTPIQFVEYVRDLNTGLTKKPPLPSSLAASPTKEAVPVEKKKGFFGKKK